jgi:ectoine hydroxylase-related dioxygenase (phytanoyl-CoA dioxygenase family)
MQEWRSRFTPELIEQYRTDGVVFLPQLIERPWLLLIENAITRILNNSSRKQRFFEGRAGEFIDTVRNFDLTPELQRLCYDSPIADMMSVLLGSDRIWLLFDHVFVKDGGDCERTPWHQDLPYWPVAGTKIGSMWITLDPIPKHECLEFIRGSHRQTIYDGFDPARVNEDPTLPYYGERYPRLPDIQATRDQWDIVSWDITPGDVVILHPGVMHGGGQTSEGRRRRTLSVRTFGDDIVFADRPKTRATAPRTPGLELCLKPGDPLRHPYYPRLRPLPENQRPDYYE